MIVGVALVVLSVVREKYGDVATGEDSDSSSSDEEEDETAVVSSGAHHTHTHTQTAHTSMLTFTVRK